MEGGNETEVVVDLSVQEMEPAEKARYLRALDEARSTANSLDIHLHRVEDRMMRLAESGVQEGLPLNDIAMVTGLSVRALRLRLKRRAEARAEGAEIRPVMTTQDGILLGQYRTIKWGPTLNPTDPWEMDLDITDEGELQWVTPEELVRRKKGRKAREEEQNDG